MNNQDNSGFTTPKKSQRINFMEEVGAANEDFEHVGTDLKRQQSELRVKIEDKQQQQQQQRGIQSTASSAWRFFQILNIFVSLLFGIGCLTLYPETHLVNKKVFLFVIFYMAISIVCFFVSLIIMIIFFLGSRICSKQPPQTNQQYQHAPSHQNTHRSNAVNDVEMYSSRLNDNNINANPNQNHYSSATNLVNAHNNDYNNYNSNNPQNVSMESDHSVVAFRTVDYNHEQVPWCNVGWFPLIYFSTLYIAYFFYLLFSTELIIETWEKIPLLISIFLGYVYVVAILHVVTALALLFSRKFISHHIEEMEEAEVYKVDDEEIQRKKQEILAARNKDIQNQQKGK